MQDLSLTAKKDGAFADRYQIVKLLGQGAAGKVYLALDTLVENEEVALKILIPELAKDEAHVKRLIREAQLTRKITHENVVRTFDVGTFDGRVFLTMEYIKGENLKNRIESNTIPLEYGIKIIKDLCLGLEKIHEAGIIHRDLKPLNILLTPEGKVKIADFGVAKPDISHLTLHDELIGSATHMAPEIWKSGEITPATDIYALGVIAYEILTGVLPFQGTTVMEYMYKHLQQEPVPPIDIKPDICRPISEIIMSMLEKDQSKRFQTVSEILDIIKKIDSKDRDDSYSKIPTEATAGYIPTYVTEDDSWTSAILAENTPEPAIDTELDNRIANNSVNPVKKYAIALLKPWSVILLSAVLSIAIGSFFSIITTPLLKNALNAITPTYFNNFISVIVLSIFSSVSVISFTAFSSGASKALKISGSSFIINCGLLFFSALLTSSMLLYTGIISGYGITKGIVLAFETLKIESLWYAIGLVPVNYSMGLLVSESFLDSKQLISSPMWVQLNMIFLSFFWLTITGKNLNRNLFGHDSIGLWLWSLVTSFLIVGAIYLETQFASGISEMLGISRNSKAFGFLPLNTYQFCCGIFNWIIFYWMLIIGNLVYRARN